MLKKISGALLLLVGLSLLLISVVYSSKSVYSQTNSMLTTTNTVPTSDIDSTIKVGLKNSSVNYHDENSVGYLVYPTNDTNQKLPAIIMIHEWWGFE